MSDQKDDLDEIIDRKPTSQRIFGHIYLTYFFTCFWIIALIIALFNLGEIESRLPNVPPWLIIGGAIILLFKNVWRIIAYHFLDKK